MSPCLPGLPELVIDCQEPDRLAAFWSAVLGGEIVHDSYGFVQVAADAGPRLTFIQVPESKVVKNRLHVDVNPVAISQAEEVERILSLGARRIDIGQGEAAWVVLADLEGNEFCVLQATVEP